MPTPPSRWLQLQLEAGEAAEAPRAVLEHLVSLEIGPAIDRTARVRLHALDAAPAVRAAIDAYFAPGSDAGRVLHLSAVADVDAFAAYLLGRKLHGLDEHQRALPFLSRALEGTPDSLRLEAHRLALESALAGHDCAQLEALAAQAPVVTAASSARANRPG